MPIAASQRGEQARAYADSALAISAAQSAGNPTDPQLHALYGVMLTMAGRSADGIREVEQALTHNKAQPNSADALYARRQLVRIQLVAGMKEQAIEGLATLSRVPSVVNPAGSASTRPSRRSRGTRGSRSC